MRRGKFLFLYLSHFIQSSMKHETARMKKKRNYIALSRQHARIDLQVPRETWKRVNILCSPRFQRPRHQEDCSEVVEVALK